MVHRYIRSFSQLKVGEKDNISVRYLLFLLKYRKKVKGRVLLIQIQG